MKKKLIHVVAHNGPFSMWSSSTAMDRFDYKGSSSWSTTMDRINCSVVMVNRYGQVWLFCHIDWRLWTGFSVLWYWLTSMDGQVWFSVILIHCYLQIWLAYNIDRPLWTGLTSCDVGHCGQVQLFSGIEWPLCTVSTEKHLTCKQKCTGEFLSFEDILKNIVWLEKQTCKWIQIKRKWHCCSNLFGISPFQHYMVMVFIIVPIYSSTIVPFCHSTDKYKNNLVLIPV